MIYVIVCTQKAWLCEKYKRDHKDIAVENY